jgi:type III pantothenate kinase
MLLAFDVGNTSTSIGCFQGEELLTVVRLRTCHERTVDEYASILFPALERRLGENINFDSAIISSVVPPVVPDLIAVLKQELNLDPLIVGPGIKTGMPIRTKDPSAVGADRIVNAVAVREKYECAAVVIDFGTATSFDVISEAGDYLGGIIAPGVQISLDALVGRTAKLPRIQIQPPEQVVGNDTVSAMRSGVVLGYQCLVEGLIEKIRGELGEVKTVVATGGYGKLFAEGISTIHAFEPNLTLDGLRLIAEKNE